METPGGEEKRRTVRHGSGMYAFPVREHKHGEEEQGRGVLQYTEIDDVVQVDSTGRILFLHFACVLARLWDWLSQVHLPNQGTHRYMISKSHFMWLGSTASPCYSIPPHGSYLA